MSYAEEHCFYCDMPKRTDRQKTELAVAAQATRELYLAYVNAGFSETEAFDLTKAAVNGPATS